MNHEEISGNVDVLVLTMKPEEREYVKNALGQRIPIGVPTDCPAVLLSSLACGSTGDPLVVLHCQIPDQGPGPAQEHANYLAGLFKPRWLFFVGICGITTREPSVTLGDVLVATRVYGPLNRAQSPDQEARASDPIGSVLRPEIESLGSQVRERWNADPAAALRPFSQWLPQRPEINLKKTEFSMEHLKAWNAEIRTNLERNFSVSSVVRLPHFGCFPFFSDAVLRKNPSELEKELRSRRDVVGVEMELGGALHGVRRNQDVLITTIRGVSDIVGLKREEKWTNYAAATAAAGLRFILDSGFLLPTPKEDSFKDSLVQILGVTGPTTPERSEEVSRPTSIVRVKTDDKSPEPDNAPDSWLAIESDAAKALLTIAISEQKCAGTILIEGLKALATRVGLYWVDDFSAKLLASYFCRGKVTERTCLAEILADFVSRTRPQGDQQYVRSQAEECALHAHWSIPPKKPFDSSIREYACFHPLIQEYFVANSLAWRYSTYSSGVKRSRRELRQIRNFLDRVYGARVNQLMKEIIAQKKADRQFESRVARTVQALLDLPEESAIAPANRTHIYYVAGRIADEKLRRVMREKLTAEADRMRKIIGTASGMTSPPEFLMMWRSLYVSLGYLGNAERLCEYIRLLLTEPEQDEHNRGFHLEYYGDQPLQEEGPTASVDRLLDFTRTKRTLIARLATPSNATLLEAQTLASLAQKRHELGKLPSREERLEIADVLHRVLRLRRPTHSAEDLNHYLEMVATDLRDDNYRPEAFLHALNRVRHLPRTGWVKRNSPQVESVGAHSFGAVSLAMDFLPEQYGSETDHDYSKLAVVSMLFNHDRAEGITGDIPTPEKSVEDDEREESIMRSYGLLETYRLGRWDGSFGRIGFARARDYFMEFQQEKTFNARLAKEIDRIDAIYEALRLLADHPQIENRDRYFQLIKGQWPKIQTELGLYVLRRVLRMDPQFEAIADHAVG